MLGPIEGASESETKRVWALIDLISDPMAAKARLEAMAQETATLQAAAFAGQKATEELNAAAVLAKAAKEEEALLTEKNRVASESIRRERAELAAKQRLVIEDQAKLASAWKSLDDAKAQHAQVEAQSKVNASIAQQTAQRALDERESNVAERERQASAALNRAQALQADYEEKMRQMQRAMGAKAA